MHLVIDDKRTPEGVDIIARSFIAGVLCLNFIYIHELTLDHDLGQEEEQTYDGDIRGTYVNNGAGVLRWLSQNPNRRPQKINLITSNPVGKQNMENILLDLGYTHIEFNTYQLEEQCHTLLS